MSVNDESRLTGHKLRTSTSLPTGRRLWMVLFTGLPFAVFKFGAGLAAAQDIHPVVGGAVMVWGALDALLNVAVLFAPVPVSFCALSNVGRLLDRRWPRPGHEDLLLAIDTLATFLIAATMIWFGRMATLPSPWPRLWAVCVIANTVGVGLERVWYARAPRQT